jgi:hypothetical protein
MILASHRSGVAGFLGATHSLNFDHGPAPNFGFRTPERIERGRSRRVTIRRASLRCHCGCGQPALRAAVQKPCEDPPPITITENLGQRPFGSGSGVHLAHRQRSDHNSPLKLGEIVSAGLLFRLWSFNVRSISALPSSDMRRLSWTCRSLRP